MSNQDHIFLDWDDEPARIAEWLAAEFGMEILLDDRGPFVHRPATADPTKRVGGLVQRNFLASDDADELIDGFPTMWDWFYTGRDERIQIDEAKLMFAALAEKIARPMVLVQGFGPLVAGFTPEAGLVWFPPDVTPYPEHKKAWEPFRARPSAK